MKDVSEEIREWKYRYKQMQQEREQSGVNEQKDIIIKSHIQMQQLKQQIHMYKLNNMPSQSQSLNISNGGVLRNNQSATIDSPNNRFSKLIVSSFKPLTFVLATLVLQA